MIPGLGKFIKQLELRGLVTTDDIAARALGLLQHPETLASIRERLFATMPQAGTAQKLALRVLERLNQLVLEQ
jgi:hypothetical protein